VLLLNPGGLTENYLLKTANSSSFFRLYLSVDFPAA
jgi:hypothetical protein